MLWRVSLVGLMAAMLLLLANCPLVWAARPTGMEGLDNESGVNRIDRRHFPQGQVAVDAYGNPVVPEEEKKKPCVRPSAGAYGGYGAKVQQERPLPDPDRETDPMWTF